MTPPLSEHIPRRDYILLPLVAVLTVVVILTCGEVLARVIWVQDDAREPCETVTASGYRFKPLCTSRTKVWEGPWITQHFNACGYRTAESCGARPAGSLRVVVLGSSTARGALVNYDDSFAALSSAALTRDCRQTVDFQNLGTQPSDVDRIDQRMGEALSLKPAAIVMTIGPFDLIHLKDPFVPAADNGEDAVQLTLRARVLQRLRDSRLFLVMQYYLYRDPDFQIHAFLLNGDAADYVRTPLSAAWQQRVADFGSLLGRIAAASGPAGLPVLLFYLPERAQAALATRTSYPPGVDPFVLARALAEVSQAHGVEFFDATRAFAAWPDFQSLFYLTDGHPSAGGHAALAGDVVRALLAEPAFAACNARRSAVLGSNLP